MAKSNLESHVESALAQEGAELVAYLVGHRFRCYEPQARGGLAELFERHGFEEPAAPLLEHCNDAAWALGAAVSRRGSSYCGAAGARESNGVTVAYKLDQLDSDDPAVRAWGVYRAERQPGQRGAVWSYGARVYSTPEGEIHASSPVDADEQPGCRALAERIASDARVLLTRADTSDLGAVLGRVYAAAGCVPFVARGTYVAPASAEPTARLVACLAELRAAYYSEDARKGVRATALQVTRADQASVSEAILDDCERRVRELVSKLRDYSTREADDAPRGSTLEKRRDEAEALIREIGAQSALLGDWGARFAEQAASLRDSFSRAVSGLSFDLPDWADASGDDSADEAPVGEPAPAAAPAPEPDPAPAPAPVVVAGVDLSVFD